MTDDDARVVLRGMCLALACVIAASLGCTRSADAPTLPSPSVAIGAAIDLGPGNAQPENCVALEAIDGADGTLVRASLGCDGEAGPTPRVEIARLDARGHALDPELVPLFPSRSDYGAPRTLAFASGWLTTRTVAHEFGVATVLAMAVPTEGAPRALPDLDGFPLALVARGAGARGLFAGSSEAGRFNVWCGQTEEPRCTYFVRDIDADGSASPRATASGLAPWEPRSLHPAIGETHGAALVPSGAWLALHRFGLDGASLASGANVAPRGTFARVVRAASRGDDLAFVVADDGPPRAAAPMHHQVVIVHGDGDVVLGPEIDTTGSLEVTPYAGSTYGFFATDTGWALRLGTPEGLVEHVLDERGAPIAEPEVVALAEGEALSFPRRVSVRRDGTELVVRAPSETESRISLRPLASWTPLQATATDDGGLAVIVDEEVHTWAIRWGAGSASERVRLPELDGVSLGPLVPTPAGFWIASGRTVVVTDDRGAPIASSTLEDQVHGLAWTGDGGLARVGTNAVVPVDALARPRGAVVAVPGTLSVARDGAVLALDGSGARRLDPLTGAPTDELVPLPRPRVVSAWSCGASCWYAQGCAIDGRAGSLSRIEAIDGALVVSAYAEIATCMALQPVGDTHALVAVADATASFFDLAGEPLGTVSLGEHDFDWIFARWLVSPDGTRHWLVAAPVPGLGTRAGRVTATPFELALGSL